MTGKLIGSVIAVFLAVALLCAAGGASLFSGDATTSCSSDTAVSASASSGGVALVDGYEQVQLQQVRR